MAAERKITGMCRVRGSALRRRQTLNPSSRVLPGPRDNEGEGEAPPPLAEVDDPALARAIVAASEAWSATAPVLIEPNLRRGELAVLPIRLPGLTLDFGLISLKNLMLSPAAEQCLDLIRQIEAELSSRNHTLIRELLS